MTIDAKLGEAIFRKSKTMMVLSLADGRILDANNAFLDWIGYSMHEFSRTKDPVTWMDVSIEDESLTADIEEASKCAKGEIGGYKLRKYYKPKGQAARLVDLHVSRHPPVGEFDCFLVEIYPIGQEKEECLLEMMTLQRKTTHAIESIQQSLKELVAGNISSWIAWAGQNPKLSIPIGMLIAFLLFGRSVIEVVEAAIKVVK